MAKEKQGAKLMGIDVEKVYALSFGIGMACLGAAACFLLPAYYVNPQVGGGFVLVAFTIVVLGGMGSFVGALVGGLHQPLHVGGGGDQGGNFCKVTWHGRASNLHRVWDSDMIEQTDLSYTELAAFASEGRSRAQTANWQTGGARIWAAESRKLRGEIYPAEVVAPTAPVSRLTYCQREVAPEAMPKLGYEYSYRFLPVVYDRIYQGGVRLAQLLEQAL